MSKMLTLEKQIQMILEREQNDKGEYLTDEQVMAEFGITQDEIDAMEDVEIE